MRKSKRNFRVCAGLILMLTVPALISAKTRKIRKYTKSAVAAAPVTYAAISSSTMAMADQIYDSLQLATSGLSEQAFKFAWRGYQKLRAKGMLAKDGILSICDFSQSSRNKRLYIIDLVGMKLLINTYVAHGRNTGGEFAKSFSNSPESHKSSLGFYVTRSTYSGSHGLSLKIDGVERGFNDRALKRNIVVHGSEYVGPSFIEENPFTGRSYGCPAVPDNESAEVINSIKDGSCLFIYYPNKTYISKSQLLKG
ncbi:murein L,D-transpeptidase catalytic domain family protein [Pinibacter soli]|uniref:Murein L,D-transpeptidase catalytic domain family protein n=1 Tax=Pinibacter soli TaxID=3044211 RepID=A0ABT6R839_9BACT|nr:murein L,D-transpeptidase catalytic domain family protein [Pinibacter soli]MDI3318732.1 murein L,D-transpeptidase catalytic domain family protein [Pinibacter soli]